MNSILYFIISFCTVSVALGAIYILCPEGNLAKCVRYVFILSLICCLISLINGVTKIKLGFPTLDKSTQSYQVSNLSTQLIFEEALKNAGVNFSEITVCTDKSDESHILISEVIVYSTEPKEKIETVIGSKDYEVTVINE